MLESMSLVSLPVLNSIQKVRECQGSKAILHVAYLYSQVRDIDVFPSNGANQDGDEGALCIRLKGC